MKSFLLRNQLYLDALIAAVFLLLWVIGEAGRHSLVHGARSIEGPWWAAVVLVALAIAMSRRWPVAAMGTITVVLIAQLLYPAMMFGAPAQAIYGGVLLVIAGVAASAGPRLRVLTAFFAGFAAVGVWGLLTAYTWTEHDWPQPVGPDPSPQAIMINRVSILVTLLVLAAVAWILGAAGRLLVEKRRTERVLEQTAGELHIAEAEALIAGERERIAQEVHDVMAHSLAVILAQADGARYVAEQRPQAVVGSLEAISDAARDSLTDVRLLIESLTAEPEGHSIPGLADVDDLVGRMRSAGLEVEVQRFGDAPDLTAAQQLAVYRIVQESLTNALRHSGAGGRARVALDARGPGLAITVASSGACAPTGAEAGHGVNGMRERARLAGGWLEAGPDHDGGEFVVTAFLPATVSEAAEAAVAEAASAAAAGSAATGPAAAEPVA